MKKKDILRKFLIVPLNKIVGKYGWEIVVQEKCDNVIRTHNMYYDKISPNLACGSDIPNYSGYYDYCRYRTFELIVEEIKKQYTEEELLSFSVAEAGVFIGDFAWIINYYFRNLKLYLYDTYEGFDRGDIEIELKNKYTDEEYMKQIDEYFGEAAVSSESKINLIKEKMVTPDNCIFRKGYFPDTINDEKDNDWIFVSLDMDLYKSIKNGIMFFWPRLVSGGQYLFMITIMLGLVV